jgi:ribosome-interacting GTPase 1
MARTQKNKATNYHLGTLKAKLAKLRSELLIEQGGGGGGGRECFASFPNYFYLTYNDADDV